MADVQLMEASETERRVLPENRRQGPVGSGFSAQRAMAASFAAAMVLMVMGAALALAGSDSPGRVILGMAAVLFIPGYLLVGALFPAWDDLSLAMRLGISVAISIALQAFLGAFLGWGPWRIHQLSVLGV